MTTTSHERADALMKAYFYREVKPVTETHLGISQQEAAEDAAAVFGDYETSTTIDEACTRLLLGAGAAAFALVVLINWKRVEELWTFFF